MQNSPVPKPYCELCKKKFGNSVASHEKSKKHKRKLPQTCEICKARVPNYKALKGHVKQLAHAALYCPTCKKFLPDTQGLNSHKTTKSHKRKLLSPPPSTQQSSSQTPFHSANRPTNIPATASASPKYDCDLCYITFKTTTQFKKHTLSPDHLKIVQRWKIEKESLAKTNPHVPIYHDPACHLVMYTAKELKDHSTGKKHIAQTQRMSTYFMNAARAGYEVDFGFVSRTPESGDPADIILIITNPFALSDIELTSIRYNRATSAAPHTEHLNPSPFSIAISNGTTLGPLLSVPAKFTFNRHGLHDGNYVTKAVLEFSTELALSFEIPITLRATLGDADLLAKLAPEGKYTRPPKTRGPDAFHAHNFNPGVKPHMLLVKSYKVPLGKNKIPKELLKLLVRPFAEQVVMPRFKDLVPLTPATYEAYFSTMVHAEEHQMNIDIRAFDLRGVVVKKTGGGGAFVLEVPGLAENRPSVLYGDRVLLLPEGAAVGTRAWEGFAHEIRETEVVLHFDDKFSKAWKKESTWDVRFTFSRTALQRMHDSVKKIGGELRQARSPGDVWRQRLFPMRGGTQGQEKMELANVLRSLKTKDEKIGNNPEQLRAVAIALTGVHGSVPLLVFGPPGTGKTSTMIECIYQLLCHPSQAGKPARILATAPTNLMADLILQLLSPYFSPEEMIRVNAPSRGVPLLHPSLEPYCRFQKTYGRPLYDFPTLPELEPFRIVVSTCGAAGILYGIGGTNLGFTHVFVDEAGQALEPEVLLALQLLENNPASGRVILCGDPYQLGPVVRSPLSKHFEYNISLLERLVRFSDSDAVPPNLRCYSVSAWTHDPAQFSDLYGVVLRNNYRSHAAILATPNNLFYHDCLVEAADRALTHSLVNHPILPTKGFPMLFRQVHGRDLRERNSPSWFNPLEVSAIVDIVISLLAPMSIPVHPKDIGIIAPYRKQVAKIRMALAVVPNSKEIDVGTTENFQGAERKVIIVSTVRATKELVEMDKGHAIGFVGDPKRFNVAVTRARALCCVVGDARVLKEDPWWRKWIEFVKRGGGWVGPEVEFEDDVDRLMSAVRKLSMAGEEDEEEEEEEETEDEDEDEDEGDEEYVIHGLAISDTEETDANSDGDDVVFVAGKRVGASVDGNDVVVALNVELQWRELE